MILQLISGSDVVRSKVACCVALRLASLAVKASAEELTVDSKNGITTVTFNGRLVLEYRFQPHPTKIYVSRWATPQGVQVLRDSPHDHVHHHALMYAIGIDDVDFWSEVPPEQFGRQVSSAMSTESSSRNGQASTTIKQDVEWQAGKQQALAREKREITAHMGVIPGASLISWQFSLEPAKGKESVRSSSKNAARTRFSQTAVARGTLSTKRSAQNNTLQQLSHVLPAGRARWP